MSDALTDAAATTLRGPGASVLTIELDGLRVPGLYAIHAEPQVWRSLGIERADDRPLYVGKAERSLASRDLGAHFAVDDAVPARTGSSTVRRSFAALLRSALDLRGVPRNPAKPDRSAHFALEAAADERLSAWMHEHLRLAVWPLPASATLVDLRRVERELIRTWRPPVNIQGNPDRLPELRLARAAMAAEARDSTLH